MDLEPIDIGRLEEAVVIFYRSTSQEQALTHEWLTKAETSPQAWQFAWQLMQLEKVKDFKDFFFVQCIHTKYFFLQSQEVQFFGAITLHSKLMKHWHEVPHGSRNELKQKILETIVQFASGPKLVLNRLCLAVSTLFALPKNKLN